MTSGQLQLVFLLEEKQLVATRPGIPGLQDNYSQFSYQKKNNQQYQDQVYQDFRTIIASFLTRRKTTIGNKTRNTKTSGQDNYSQFSYLKKNNQQQQDQEYQDFRTLIASFLTRRKTTSSSSTVPRPGIPRLQENCSQFSYQKKNNQQ